MLVSELISQLKDSRYVKGPTERDAILFCSADKPTAGGVTYLTKTHSEKIQSLIHADVALVLIEEEIEIDNYENTAVVLVNNSRASIAQLLQSNSALYPLVNKKGLIDPETQIDKYTNIDPSVGIGKLSKIGFGSSIINATQIGSRTIVGSNTSIGGDGFGYILEGDRSPLKFPHVSNVIIGDDVEIGSNVCIDRGALSPTIIESGVKIDNLVHVGHNVEIGKNSLIIAKSVLCGSVKIGENVWISPGTIVLEGVKIGKNSVVGLGSTVLKDVEPNSFVIGNPARKIRDIE